MKPTQNNCRTASFTCLNICLLIAIPFFSSAQFQVKPIQKSINTFKEINVTSGVFIENIGQYGNKVPGYEYLGTVKYGYEGLDMPVLFTAKGIIHLQRKLEQLSKKEEENFEKQGLPENEIERKKIVTDRTITMEWLGANPQTEIIAKDKSYNYHTYGLLPEKAFGYESLTYKNLYPGIDVVYFFNKNKKHGYEYSIVASPGANLGLIRMRFGGDLKKIKIDKKGNLQVLSDINGITETIPVSYYGTNPKVKTNELIETKFQLSGNEVYFSLPEDYDHSRNIVVDPFVSATSNLTGLNAGKAKDVDFDYAGNVYVTGGGDGTSSYSLAKFNAAGVLQWTFNGTLTIPAWSYGPYYGGSVVDKTTGNIYLGQGFIYPAGFRVIRISTTGLYDNYITTPNANFTENWKMYWACNGGTPQILIAGGGINSSVNFGTFTPPSTIINSLNVTGLTGAGQDIVDLVIDPANNEMYTAYASLFLSPGINNKIYKNTAPYSAASVAWNVPSGYTSLSEAANRPYLGLSLVDNSANIFAVNASFLFYWDGKNLKAFNKATGAIAGTALSTANTALMQGGIIADACNNIYIGSTGGVIKVYHFNGNVFDDAAVPDIVVSGYAGSAVYDLAFDEFQKYLYASGDGFVASFDVSAYCNSNIYMLNIVPNCAAANATATVSPAPPAGSTVTYVLYIGNNQITSNTTGVFTGLLPITNYTVVATVNFSCSGVRTTSDFTLPGPVIAVTPQNSTCGNSTGQIDITASGGTSPYTYSIDGTNYFPGATFSGLPAGIYTISVKDLNGCKNTTVATIINTDGPVINFTNTNATCGNNTGTVTVNATGGTAPYQYSINNGLTYQSGNIFTGLIAGQYTLVIKDANACLNSTLVNITSSTSPLLTAIPASATCGNNNGSITAFGSGGVSPLEYSINGNIFQGSNIFINLTPGIYTVSVRDATGCIKAVSVTVANAAAPTLSATATTAACGNVNGTITATGNGGVAPLQYSLDGTTFQASNIFTGLAPGAYIVTVKDASGCTRTFAINVGTTGGPIVSASSTASNCSVNDGTITAIASGTIGTYQYSINGVSYQFSGTFTGLAPGNYIILAKDGNGCISAVSVTVSSISGPLVTAVSTASACNINDGTITATGTGGTAPLEFSIDGITFQGSNLFTGLAPNTYTVTVKDANGCTKTTTVSVVNASGLTLTVSTISTSCNIINGVITATASGGQAPLQYSINGIVYQASNVFNGLSAAIYTVYVKDANNCIVTKPATVSSVSSTTLSVTTMNATCAVANGAIAASGSGGLAPLRYSIDGVTYQLSGTFINVAAGSYTVYVKDSLGCIATQPVTITTSGTGPGISAFTVKVSGAYPCNGSLGKITNPRVNGATCGSCTYSLNFGPFVPHATQLFTNLSLGTYTVTAKDVNGCTKTIIVTIENAALSTASAVVTGTACNTSNGSITLTGIGPKTPYHASISGIAGPWIDFDPNFTFTGLAPGTYEIILADDESFDSGPPVDPGGCLDTIIVIVPSIGGPSISTNQINGTCLNQNGSITANGTGGTGTLQYSIDGFNFQPGNIFNNLLPGDYTVTVQDDAGCSNSTQVTLPVAAGPAVTASVLSISCNLANGSIIANGTGGTPPYQYSINGTVFQSSNTFLNLSAGSYILYIKDVQGCFNTRSVVITTTPRPVVTAFTVPATCDNNDGSIFAAGSSGNAPYKYSIDGIVYQSSNIFNGLAAGFYSVYIKDARDCINTTGINLLNIGAPAFTTAITAAKCGNANGSITVTASGGALPYGYSIDGVNFQAGNILTALLPGNYTITVKGANGCLSTKTVLVGNSAGPHTLTATVINAACGLNNGSITAAAVGGTAPLQYSINGITYQAGTVFNAIGAAAYTLYVKDVNGCIKTLPVNVLNLPGPSVTATSTPASCSLNDGTITATSSGGTGTVTYSRNGITFQASNIFTGLPAGTYIITVRDTRLCTSTTVVTINPFLVPTALANTTDATCGNANGSITVNGSGGAAPYQYSLDGITYQAGNIFNGLAANTYLVRIKDANSCVGTLSVVLSDSPPLNGVYTVGAGGDFSTLTAAVNAYNTQCIAGAITFLLIDADYSLNETFPVTINSNIYASAVKTLTIKPDLNIMPVISDNNDVAILKFNGADHIIIDGSNTAGGSSRDLSFINASTNASTSTVIFINSVNASNGATNITIKNCLISGDSPVNTYAAIISGGSIAGSMAEAANENILIQNNLVIKAQNAILLNGPAGNETGNIITENSIGSVAVTDKLTRTGIGLQQQSNCQVLNNSISGIITGDNVMVSGISVTGEIAGLTISGNRISDIKNTNTLGSGSNGIYLASASTAAAVSVNNNFISDVASYGNTGGRAATDNGYGIVVDNGGGYDIYHNTVVLNSNQQVAGNPAAMNITALVTSPAAINIKDNIFGNIQTQPGNHYTIQSTAANTVIASIDYNDYYTASGSLGYNSSDRATLADIQTGFSENLNSINVTPVYISAADFHIDPANVSNGVNLGDRGTVAGIVTDIDNTSRSGFSPDMGADEWLRPNYGSWVGRVSIDWLVPENWETNVVPDGNTDVTIKGGFVHMPTIVTTQAVRDLNMSSPDLANKPILTLSNGTIQINGVINHTGGNIDGILGTVEMNGTMAQLIPAGLFQGNGLNNLVVGNNTAAGVTLGGTLDIYRAVTFSPAGLKLTTGDFLTLKSTATETAWLGNMTGKSIEGSATVERYIPDHFKAWQLLAVPTTGQTIKQAWQEGSASPNSNPKPGYGTMLTSNVPDAATHPNPGYDLFSTSPSIKVYNASTGLYDALASTNDPIANPKGYMLFVRGDRSVTTFSAPPTATVLRTKGILHSPANPPAVITVQTAVPPLSFESIGNPYASAIDLTQLTLNETGGGVQDIFYVWDPKLTNGANSAYGLGGFQVLTRNGSTYDVTPGGGSYGATNKFIQSGQAFFVNAPFNSGTVKFTEASKVSGSNMVNRGENTVTAKQLRTNLYVIKNGEPVLIDGNRLFYNRSYSNSLDMQDAVKFKNTGENLGIRSNGKTLSVERRKPIVKTDTIFYQLGQLKIQQYQFEFIASDLRQEGLAAFLEDTYLHIKTPVHLNRITKHTFNVENTEGSYAPDRFRIVFSNKEEEDEDDRKLIVSVKGSRNEDNSITVSWNSENESGIQSYIVERSHDGRHFEVIKTIQQELKRGKNTASYSAIDQVPHKSENFYRIRAVLPDGNDQYSDVVKLMPVKAEKGITVYPNPITGRNIQLRFTDQAAGEYYVFLFNQLGQPVFNTRIKLNKGETVKTILLDKEILAGTYQLSIVPRKGQNFIHNIFIQ